MKKLDVQDLFEYGRAAIAILRSLEVQQLTMSYAVPARGIDLRRMNASTISSFEAGPISSIASAPLQIKRLSCLAGFSPRPIFVLNPHCPK